MLFDTKVQRTRYCKLSPTLWTTHNGNENSNNNNYNDDDSAYAMLQLISPNVWETKLVPAKQKIYNENLDSYAKKKYGNSSYGQLV